MSFHASLIFKFTLLGLGMLGLSTAPLSVSLSAQDEAAASVDEVVESYIEAMGGRMSVEVESFKASGVIKSSPGTKSEKVSYKTSFHYKDGMFGIKFEADGDDVDSFYGYDQTGNWNRTGSSAEAKMVPANSLGWMKRIPFIAQQALHWQEYAEVTRLEDTTFLDQEVTQLKVDFGKKNTITHLFSKETGLLIASDLSSENYIFYEYKEVEGLLCISAVRIGGSSPTSERTYDYEFEKFELNADIPDAVFERPDEDEEDEDEEQDEGNEGEVQDGSDG